MAISKSPKHFATMTQYIKFSENTLFNSRDIIQNPYFGQNLTFQSAGVTLKIKSKSPKYNPHFPFS